MTTIEIGAEVRETRLPATDVRSPFLHVESRVERVGDAPGDVFHARSFPVSRRIVLASGLDREAGLAVLDLLDELPQLGARETAGVIAESAACGGRSNRFGFAELACAVLEAGKRRVDFAVFGSTLIALKHPPAFWRPARVVFRDSSSESRTAIAEGVVRLCRGDRLLVFAGFGLSEAAAGELLEAAAGSCAAQARQHGARGCLAVIGRLPRTRWGTA